MHTSREGKRGGTDGKQFQVFGVLQAGLSAGGMGAYKEVEVRSERKTGLQSPVRLINPYFIRIRAARSLARPGWRNVKSAGRSTGNFTDVAPGKGVRRVASSKRNQSSRVACAWGSSGRTLPLEGRWQSKRSAGFPATHGRGRSELSRLELIRSVIVQETRAMEGERLRVQSMQSV